MFDLLGQIGGLYVLLHLVFKKMSIHFASKRMEAILINRLYHMTPSDKTLYPKIQNSIEPGDDK